MGLLCPLLVTIEKAMENEYYSEGAAACYEEAVRMHLVESQEEPWFPDGANDGLW